MSKGKRNKPNAKRSEKGAQRRFIKAMSKLTSQRKPMAVNGLWVFGYVTQENLLIAPVVLNVSLFPVGIPIYTEESAVVKRVQQEKLISKKVPLPYGQTVHHYQLGRELDPVVYARAGLHQFRNAMTTYAMKKIKDVAEDEFRSAIVFVDPPLLKVDDDLLMGMFKDDRLRLISCVEEWDIEEICAWNSDA